MQKNPPCLQHSPQPKHCQTLAPTLSPPELCAPRAAGRGQPPGLELSCSVPRVVPHPSRAGPCRPRVTGRHNGSLLMIVNAHYSAVRRAPPAASPLPVPSARCRRAQSSRGHPVTSPPPRLCNHLPRPLLLLHMRTEAGKGWQPKSHVEGDFLGHITPFPPVLARRTGSRCPSHRYSRG